MLDYTSMLNIPIQADYKDIIINIPDKSIDLILTDPPFNKIRASWDTSIDLDFMWSEFKRVIKPNGAILIFAMDEFSGKLWESNKGWYKYKWIWEKTQASGFFNAKKRPMSAFEEILVFYKNQPTYNPQKTQGHKPVNSYTKRMDVCNKTEVYGKVKIDVSGGGNTDRYPRSVLKYASDKQKNKLNGTYLATQKPLKLIENLILTYSNENDIVLDPFSGSFTTALAAKNTKRNYVCIEKELKHYTIGLKRLTANGINYE